MTAEQETEKIVNVANAARAFIATWDEFNGDPSYVGEHLDALIDAVDATGDDDAKPKTSMQYLAEIGTLRNLLEIAKEQRDEAVEDLNIIRQLYYQLKRSVGPEHCEIHASFSAGCFDCRLAQRDGQIEELKRQYAALEQFVGVPQAKMAQQIEALRANLVEIKEGRKPQVCAEFEICTHEGCASSHAAYEIADQALDEYRKWKDGQQ